MGYFANATEGNIYHEMYCERCVNFPAEGVCPVWWLHVCWSDEQQADPVKAYALDEFIPRNDGDNEQCTMFTERASE